MIKLIVVAGGLVLLIWASPAIAAQRGYLPLIWEELLAMSYELVLPHEGQAEGVPAEYDWAHGPRLGAGNDPAHFKALTGWGQAFSAKGSTTPALSLSVRDMRVLVCHGPQREWLLLQQGLIEGSQFRPDYAENRNKPALFIRYAGNVTSVGFEKGLAFHFWPKQGRASLPGKDLCGVLVLLQARTAVSPQQTVLGQAERSGILLGLGADYWTGKGAVWDNYRSNRDVAIGRLRWVDSTWSWFGFSTASIEDLRKLHRFGYEIATTQSP